VNGLAADAVAVGDLDHGSGLGRYRWVVERTFAWLHQFKPLRIRWSTAPTFTRHSSSWHAASSDGGHSVSRS
jgi:transposase